MSDIAIRVEGLSKQYRIGGQQARYKTLRESLVSAAQAPIRRAGRLLHGEAATDRQETIWALKDVSFEVKHGEVLGIIGRNGAGKSTLLKILSRITTPTEGIVDLYGRVGSLLEVGTGFHPELTGRENIYLNGAILGMKRTEIDRKFDEIVGFAELEKFLDTPVKHYSSGMYVRLAFAVAAHLDPEILLVDEVLAVGDAAFQKKCLGKMGEVAHEGRTVLFVSHNMAAVESLCMCAVLLDGGNLMAMGGARAVIDEYMDRIWYSERSPAQPLGNTIKDVETQDSLGKVTGSFRAGDPMRVVFHLDTQDEEITSPVIGIGFNGSLGQRIFTVGTYFYSEPLPSISGKVSIVCDIPAPALGPGHYSLKVALGRDYSENFDSIEDAARIQVVPSDFYGTGRLPDAHQGPVLVRSHWKVLER